jgi:hypothetical protein
MRFTHIAFILIGVATIASGQQVQDINQLVGKRVIAQRMPLCEPGTYNHVIAYAGKQATVLSAKPSQTMPAISQKVLAKMPPEARAMVEDQQKAATVLVQFEDGTKLDTCAPIGPAQILQYFELAEGETLAAPALANTAATLSPSAAEPVKQLNDAGILTIHVVSSHAESSSEVSADNTLRHDPFGNELSYTAYTVQTASRGYVLEISELYRNKVVVGQDYEVKSISGNTMVVLVPGKKHPTEVRAHIKSVSER